MNLFQKEYFNTVKINKKLTDQIGAVNQLGLPKHGSHIDYYPTGSESAQHKPQRQHDDSERSNNGDDGHNSESEREM